MDDTLRRFFRHPAIVMSDLRRLLSKYRELKARICSSNNGVYMKIEGTIPYAYSGGIYNAPIIIKLHTIYPYAAPSLCVVSSETIKMVNNHPTVDQQGVVKMPYITAWKPKNNLVDAVDLLQLSFNLRSPIYSVVSHGPQTPTPSEMSRQTTPRDAESAECIQKSASISSPLARSNISTKPSDPFDDAKNNIMTVLKSKRTDIVTGYHYNVEKYELHTKLMLDWIPTCIELGETIRDQYKIMDKLNSDLCREEEKLRELEKMHKDLDAIWAHVSEYLKVANEFESKTNSEECDIQGLVRFYNQDSETLCTAIANEATKEDILEFLHHIFKKRRIGTKTYIQEIRASCHDKFLERITRSKMTDALKTSGL